MKSVDVDFDTEKLKRNKIIKTLKNKVGYFNVLNIATFGTEKPKACVQTACRGYRSEEFPDGIDVDIAQYISSMIPVERGFQWSIHECFYGDEAKGRKPIKEFIEEIEKYEGLKDIIFSIEGLVNKRGVHASGVYIFNNGFMDYTAMMKAPSGVEITQYDMGDCDYQGCLKYDFLTTEASDKIRKCLDLLIEYKFIEDKGILRENYNSYLHPDVLDYENKEMWAALGHNEIIDAFQMNTPVGQDALRKIKPTNLVELAHVNSLMRLAGQLGKISPIDKYVAFRDNIELWYEEMNKYSLSKKDVEVLSKYLKQYYGVAATQEDVMKIVMDEEICNMSLKEANKIRKAIAKKKASMIDEIKEMVFSKATSFSIANYVWSEVITPQLGYSFSICHTTPYSIICIQEMNLYHFFPHVFWNTACLTASAAIAVDNEEDNEDTCIPMYNEIEFIIDEDEEEETIEKKKSSSTKYDKIAVAIGEIQNKGITVALPNINKSVAEFTPDVETNSILYGLKGITNVSDDTINQIVENRPFSSFEDFKNKVKVTKTVMINLIKAGCFDCFNSNRIEVMALYILEISNPKKTLNLRNFQGLCNENLIPEELDDCKYAFTMNKFLKKNKDETNYIISEELFPYFENCYGSDSLFTNENNQTVINQKVWDKEYYQPIMDKARAYIKNNLNELLYQYNFILFQKEWENYCSGTISKWEMDSVSFYFNGHELEEIKYENYGLSHFSELQENPEPIRFFKHYPIYNIYQIAGTVLSKNKNKSTITLLDADGSVVTIKFRKEYFNLYDKQISEKQPDGTKKVIEKSWFKRGNKIIVAGYRRENDFVPKTYSSTPFRTLYNIISIKDGKMVVRDERVQ